METTGPDRTLRTFRLSLAAVFLGWLTAGGSFAQSIVINEFLYRSSDPDLEFVEFFNRSSSLVDLAEFSLSDARRRPVAIASGRYPLPPGAFAVAARNGAAFDVRFSDERVVVAGWPALNNSGDTIILWRGDEPVDSVTYTSSWGGDDVSLERLDPAGPTNSTTNWAESVDRSGGTPGRINSTYAPDETAPRAVFCEELSPGLLELTFTEPIDPTSIHPDAFVSDRQAAVTDAEPDPSGTSVWLTILESTPSATIEILGVRDLAGNRLDRQEIPIARIPQPDEIRLNEIMFEPLSDAFDGEPNQTEYIELLSNSQRHLSVRSLWLTDELREDGSRDTLSFASRRAALQPGGIVLLYARSDPKTDPLAAFPSLDHSSRTLVLVENQSSSLGLGNNGDRIRLESARGVVDDIAYSPAWHLPELAITRGVALERISVTAATEDEGNWTSSVDPEGGTPGRQNSVASSVHIEEQTRTTLIIEPSPFSPDGDGFEDAAEIYLTLPYPSAIARIWIYDRSGNRVREVTSGRAVGSRSSIIWDGRSDRGDFVSTGLYLVFMEAVSNRDGVALTAKTPVAVTSTRPTR